MTSEVSGPSHAQQAGPLAGTLARAEEAILPAAPQSAGLARQTARDVLVSWRLTHLAETAVLLVSELVTNAVRHAGDGGPTVTLRLEIRGAWLRIEVHDTDPRGPQRRWATGLEESGFGMVLVESLAAAWGVCETASGKAVWAELPAAQDGKPAG